MEWINRFFSLLLVVIILVLMKLAWQIYGGAKQCHYNYLKFNNDKSFKGLRNGYCMLLVACASAIIVAIVTIYNLNI